MCDQLWLDKRGTHRVWGFLSAWSTIHKDITNFNKITSVSDIVVKTDPGRAVQWNPPKIHSHIRVSLLLFLRLLSLCLLRYPHPSPSLMQAI